ncbi:MAG: hypothetical protein IT377_30960 [Polyangiaceae bacterium]|nr:hypothetical protein [Polyangiaceae bacterium]
MDSTKLGLDLSTPASDELGAERRRRQEAEKWAHTLAASVASAWPDATECPAETGTPVHWRPSDGELTPGAGPLARAAGAPSEDANSESPVRVSVNAGDLGEVDIVVDRSAQGVRVIIGLADPNADTAMIPELSALQRALEASGIRVASVRAVAQSRVGTVLAQSKFRVAKGHEPLADGEHESRRRSSKRLNLIG